MKKIIVLSSVVAAVVFAITHEKRPPLPAQLAKFECKPDSKEIANDYYVFRVANTRLVKPCTKQEGMDDVKKQWDRSYERSLFFHFMKRSDGVFEKLEGRPNADKSSARYIVRASVHPQPLSDPPRLDRSSWEDIGYNGRRWEVSVPTPQAFAATGPSSTIVCFTPKNLYEKFGRRCVAYVRSNSLYWYINIDFPPPRRPAAPSEEAGDGSAVVDPELVKFHQAMESNSIEAYNLLATHILTQ